MWNKQATLALLKAQGISRVHIEFSGGNDEGGVDDIKFYKPVKQEPDIRGALKLERVTETEVTLDRTQHEALYEACEESVYSQYHGFAGEFEVYGKVNFDVEAGTVVMETNEADRVWREGVKEL